MSSISELSGIEATFGLNLLNSIGTEESYVFSPISLLFALTFLRDEKTCSPKVKDTYSNLCQNDSEIHYYLKTCLDDIVVKPDSGVNDLRRDIKNQTRIMFNDLWESQLDKSQYGTFFSTKTTSKSVRYLIGQKHVLLKSDGVFKAIFIPYDNQNLHFFVMVPCEIFGLKKALKRLSKTRFDYLLKEAKQETVDIMIPKFNIRNILHTSRNLGLQPPIKTSLKYKTVPRTAQMMFRPENREPYVFQANHPFVFGIIRSSRPMYLGVFSG